MSSLRRTLPLSPFAPEPKICILHRTATAYTIRSLHSGTSVAARKASGKKIKILLYSFAASFLFTVFSKCTCPSLSLDVKVDEGVFRRSRRVLGLAPRMDPLSSRMEGCYCARELGYVCCCAYLGRSLTIPRRRVARRIHPRLHRRRLPHWTQRCVLLAERCDPRVRRHWTHPCRDRGREGKALRR